MIVTFYVKTNNGDEIWVLFVHLFFFFEWKSSNKRHKRMSTISSKHKPRHSLPDVDLRKTPYPHRHQKEEVDREAIVLGSNEPPEGRYDTLSRQTYKNHVGGSLVKSKDEVQAESRTRKNLHQSRNFYWNESQLGGALLMTENKGAHLQPTPDVLKAAREYDTKGNSLLMSNSSIFVSDKAVETWRGASSTVREDFRRPTNDVLKANRGTATEFRKLQQGTHFVMGSENKVPTSESRAMFQGANNKDRTVKSKINMVSTINIGSNDVPTSETLRSLKQVDFVNHTTDEKGQPKKQPQAVRNNLQRHNLVLGYQQPVSASLYRASFTPTEYYDEPKATGPVHKPRF